MNPIDPKQYRKIVFFTGAGMSAECGVPTYRGSGGIWHQYNWQEYACQEAFDEDPQKVLEFHELRRQAVLKCQPHKGHATIANIEKEHGGVSVVTQNIDGMHQRAGSRNVMELHGSLWRLRCPVHGPRQDLGETYERYQCEICGRWLRPDIVWFGDMLDEDVIEQSISAIGESDLFVSIGTSGVVFPAAGFPRIARDNGARCIEINPEPNEMSGMYDEAIRQPAAKALTELFV
jgi:NAD-dependent deacetylase